MTASPSARPPRTQAWRPAGFDHGDRGGQTLPRPQQVRPGFMIAIASTAYRSNGCSLVRHVLLEQEGVATTNSRRLSRTLGESFLKATRIYARPHELLARAETHAMSHITGRNWPPSSTPVPAIELAVTLDRTTSSPHPPGRRPAAWHALRQDPELSIGMRTAHRVNDAEAASFSARPPHIDAVRRHGQPRDRGAQFAVRQPEPAHADQTRLRLPSTSPRADVRESPPAR